MGIAVLRMDDRGFGGSGGSPGTATTADLAEDIKAGVAFLGRRPEIRSARVFLLGHSEGGLIAPMLAAEDPSLRGIVVMAGPSQTGREIIRFQNREAIEGDSTIRPGARDSALTAAMQRLDSTAVSQAWIRYFLDHDPLPTARRVMVPTLILQGATDRQVTAGQAEVLGAAIRAGGNRDVTVRVFPDANHLFLQDPSGSPTGYGRLPSGEIRGDVIGAITSWLAGRVR